MRDEDEAVMERLKCWPRWTMMVRWGLRSRVKFDDDDEHWWGGSEISAWSFNISSEMEHECVLWESRAIPKINFWRIERYAFTTADGAKFGTRLYRSSYSKAHVLVRTLRQLFLLFNQLLVWLHVKAVGCTIGAIVRMIEAVFFKQQKATDDWIWCVLAGTRFWCDGLACSLVCSVRYLLTKLEVCACRIFDMFDCEHHFLFLLENSVSTNAWLFIWCIDEHTLCICTVTVDTRPYRTVFKKLSLIVIDCDISNYTVSVAIQ